MTKIAHIITTTATGGAEMMLYKLLSGINRDRYENIVFSLLGRGAVGEKIEDLDIRVEDINCHNLLSAPAGLWAFARALRQYQPDIIQGWMYHGNLLASLAAGVSFCRAPQIWNIRQTLYGLHLEKPVTRLIIRAGSMLSTRPQAIIYNSSVSARQHEKFGYSPERTKILPNGFDLQRFCPSSASVGQDIRRRLKIPENAPLIGLVARYHPMKGHTVFFRAAADIVKRFPACHFLLAGKDITFENPLIKEMVVKRGLQNRVRLLGERSDIVEILSALDVAVSASLWGEGFPNAVGEAMACAVPCVVTDVGDSPWIVDQTGLIVSAADHEQLAEAICRMLTMTPDERKRLGASARQRIAAHFSLPDIIKKYTELYDRISDGHGG